MIEPSTMEALLSAWEGEELIVQHDPPTGAWMIVALHSSTMGPPTGGTRFKDYPDLNAAIADALQLSQGMTRKYAIADFPRGGGKAVILPPPGLSGEDRLGLLRRYGEIIQGLAGRFFTGPDVGTAPADMDVIAETGAPYVFARTPAAGGAGSSGPATALGVFAGILAACEHVFGPAGLEGRSVLVQGVGSVGATLVERLIGAGATVLCSDVDAGALLRLAGRTDVAFVEPEQVADAAVDVLAPCALGGTLNERTIPRMRCRIVAGGANNQLASPTDDARLAARGILYVPDYAINIGGAMAITGIEAMGWSLADAEARVVQAVDRAVRRILERAAREGISTEVAAQRLAAERLAQGPASGGVGR